MYQIKCDDYVLHDPRIDELKVIGAKCSLEVNKTGALSFQIHSTHPYYNMIKKHLSQITLLQDGEVLFCGRVLNDNVNINNIKTIECEGSLSYLIDSVQRPSTFKLDDVTIEDCLKILIDNHNAQVDDYKKFKVGNVTITHNGRGTSISTNYENTLNFINEKLVKVYGGYLIVRNEVDGRYIDYISEYTNNCNQMIRFGENIVDLTNTIKGENIYTVILPSGNFNPFTGKYPSLAEFPDGFGEGIVKQGDYIYNPEGVAKYGFIWKHIKYDTIYADKLFEWAIADLKLGTNVEFTLELTAIDLHLINVNIDKISIGDMVRCLSEPHNIDVKMFVSAITIDLDNPANTKIKLVLPEQVRTNLGDNLTQKITDDKKSTEKEINDNVDRKLIDNNDTLKKWVSDNFTPLTSSDGGTVDLSDYAKNADVDTKINDLKNWTDNNYVPRESISDPSQYVTKSDLNTNNNDLKDWTNNNYVPKTDLSAYAKIVDVNTAFDELATALGGL